MTQLRSVAIESDVTAWMREPANGPAAGLILSQNEIQSLTGYKRPTNQLAELRRLGFHRARRSATTGRVILEREHYAAVSASAKQSRQADDTPKLNWG